MSLGQERTPRAVQCAAGVLVAGLALLTAHNWLHVAWPPYPDGLAGEAIPLGARIIAVCDAFDAMTTTRPYRKAMSDADAVAELRHCAGHQFDSRVVAAFERTIGAEHAGVPERLAA